MYGYIWDPETHGFLLNTRGTQYIANEIRPVFAQELIINGMDKHFKFDHNEKRPLMWAQKNIYYVDGQKVAKLINTTLGKSLSIEYSENSIQILEPVNIGLMIEKNRSIMDLIVSDTKRRAKELYDRDIKRCDIAYLAFSGGKDSVVLLDICNEVLPASVPIIYSDTDMELPDSYQIWDEIQEQYQKREFIKASAEEKAINNWIIFGPPSRSIRWCCSVHKSTPALITLKKKLFKDSIKVMAFVGVRREESYARSSYEDSSEGKKNASQINCMPLSDWGAHEIWLYIFMNNLKINNAYRMGLPRVGCIMCPESSTYYEWIIEQSYPEILAKYKQVIKATSAKEFKDEKDVEDFLGSQGWQARKSGSILVDYLSNPYEKREGTKSTFLVPNCPEHNFFEWIKTIGIVFMDEDGNTKLQIKTGSSIPFHYESSQKNFATIIFEYNGEEQQNTMFQDIRTVLRKSMSCVGCRTCEAECTFGAITFNEGRIKIDSNKCTQCHRCYDIEQGCWRFRSMYKPDSEQMKMTSINSYCRFGLREKDQYTWISTLIDLGEDFFPWTETHPLGSKMVTSASKWFQQSLLVEEKTRKPTLLVDIFKRYGSQSALGWEFIWMALANNSLLIKWYITSTDTGKLYTIDQLNGMIKETDSTLAQSTIEGGLSAFKDFITKSPIGEPGFLIEPQMKGKIVTGATRLSKTVDPLTVLYGLYLIAEKSGRSGFSVRDLIAADKDSTYVSPIIAFNIPVEDFKKTCEGLKTKYPDYISLTFTYGNDGIDLHTDKYSIEDIIKLALER